jgi:hypothetical protein
MERGQIGKKTERDKEKEKEEREKDRQGGRTEYR